MREIDFERLLEKIPTPEEVLKQIEESRAPRRVPLLGPTVSPQGVDQIVLHDVVLYNAKGQPFQTYDRVSLDSEAAKDEEGKYLIQNQDEWITYWNERGRTLPSLPLWYAMIEKMHEERHPSLVGVITDLRESWPATSTRLNYVRNIVTHDKGFSSEYTVPCTIPDGNFWLGKVMEKEDWRDAFQALLLYKDVEKAVCVLENASGLPLYLWTASKETRILFPEMATWFSFSTVRFIFYCGNNLNPNIGRSRSVVLG